MLKWTKAKPSEPGEYWVRTGTQVWITTVECGEYMPDEWFDVYMEWRAGPDGDDHKKSPPKPVGVYVVGGDHWNDTSVNDLDREWAGPIPLPED